MTPDPMEHFLEKIPSPASLSAEERGLMRSQLREYARFKPVRDPSETTPSRTHWTVLLSAASLRRYVGATLAMFLVVGVTSTSLVSAAEGALPGELLYGLKTGFVEPARLSFAQTVETRQGWERLFAERRLVEAAVLADQGRLTKSAETTLVANFEHYVELALQSSTPTDEESTGADAETLSNDFSARLSAYEAILDHIDTARGATTTDSLRGSIRTQANKIARVSPPDSEADDEPRTTRLMQAADRALVTSTTLIDTLPPEVPTTTSARAREALEQAWSARKQGDELLNKRDLRGASQAFKESLKATSRLNVFTEAATTLKIDAFSIGAVEGAATSTVREKEESPSEDDSSKHRE